MPNFPYVPTKAVEGGIEEQSGRVMDNTTVALKGFDSGFDLVVLAKGYFVNFQFFI